MSLEIASVKLQLQALHLLIMLLPDASRDAAKVGMMLSKVGNLHGLTRRRLGQLVDQMVHFTSIRGVLLLLLVLLHLNHKLLQMCQKVDKGKNRYRLLFLK